MIEFKVINEVKVSVLKKITRGTNVHTACLQHYIVYGMIDSQMLIHLWSREGST